MKKNWPAFSLVLLVLLTGGYLRLAHLGRDNFGPDELFHVYAAESLRQGEGPRLPSGSLYTRGIDITRLVAVATERLGPGEASARLPSALFGIVDLCLFAAVLWALGGGWTAFWGTLLLAVYPEAIEQSRSVRFYTYQLAFGLIALYTGWRALARAGTRGRPGGKEFLRQWLWMAVTILALALATRVHIVTLSVAAGWVVCIVFAAAADQRARGAGTWRTSAPVQMTVALAAAVLLLFLVQPELIWRVVRLSQRVPDWAQVAGTRSSLTYARALFWSFPVLFACAPLIFLTLGVSRPRLTLYLFTWFIVPFVAHSFILPWKGQRFILLAVPALFAAAALAAASAAQAIREWMSNQLTQLGLGARTRHVLASSSVAVVSLFLVVTTPALVRGWETVSQGQENEWRRMAEIVAARPELRKLPLGTSDPLHTLYYLGRADFVIEPGARPNRQHSRSGGDSDNAADFQAGAPILPTPLSIRSRFDAQFVLISTDSGHVDSRLDPALLSMLEEAEDLCRGSCGSGLLYLWHTSDLPSGVALPTSALDQTDNLPEGAAVPPKPGT